MNSVISVENLTRRFGDLVAVDHISFEVSEGEIFGFLGPNGAGKTTTVRMLTGVIDPTQGMASIRGHDIRREPLNGREHIAVVPEEANVYLDLSLWRNVMLMAELHSVPRQRRHSKAEKLLEQMGLNGRKHQKARALSKGLRQRLMLCCALVTEPDIVFLDEPTSGLDVHSTRLIWQIVDDLNDDGLTVFLTTHNMEEAEQMCSRVAIINEGQIAAIDTPSVLRGAIKAGQYVEVGFHGTAPETSALEKLEGVSKVSKGHGTYRLYAEAPGPVAILLGREATEKGWDVDSLCTRRPGLEDVFVQLTGKERR